MYVIDNDAEEEVMPEPDDDDMDVEKVRARMLALRAASPVRSHGAFRPMPSACTLRRYVTSSISPRRSGRNDQRQSGHGPIGC